MKRITYLLLPIFVLLISSSILAQGRYGADSANCIKYLSFYQEYMKQGNLNDAAPLWRKAIKSCPPQANQNMLLDGMKILRKEIFTFKKNPIRTKELTDSLIMLHDMRINNYPKYLVTASNNKVLDMISYLDDSRNQEIFNEIKEVIDVTKQKTSIAILVRYIGYASDLYKEGKIKAEDVMEAFQKSNEILDLMEKAKPSEQIKNAKNDVENLFMQSGVASCENIVNLFKPRYEANPNDKELLVTMVAMFSATNCVDEHLFRAAVEGLHKVEPSANSAYLLFKLYCGANDYEKAEKYINEAIASPETNKEKDGEYYFEFASYLYKSAGKPAEAVKAAKSAAELSSAISGKAYFLIATIWASQKCQGNEVEIRSPFWIAVDYLIKAKNADATLANEADNLISNYSKYFPLQSEAFMYDVLDGSSYTVSCGGLRETTKVRTQK